MNNRRCPHEYGPWGAWTEGPDGVTHVMEYRDRKCVHCGQPDRETRNGRKL